MIELLLRQQAGHSVEVEDSVSNSEGRAWGHSLSIDLCHDEWLCRSSQEIINQFLTSAIEATDAWAEPLAHQNANLYITALTPGGLQHLTAAAAARRHSCRLGSFIVLLQIQAVGFSSHEVMNCR